MASLRATCSESSVPALVVTLGSVPMVDELPVASNGVASLGSPFVDYYSPHPSPSSQACADGSIAPVSESSVEFHLFIELVSVGSPLWSMLPRRWPSRVLTLCWRGISVSAVALGSTSTTGGAVPLDPPF